MATRFPMIDPWVNPNFAVTEVDPAVAGLFRGLAERRRRGTTLPQLVDEMDEANVRRAILCAGYRGADNLPWVAEAIQMHPDRFAGSLVVDPRTGMAAVRAIEHVVRDLGFVLIRVLALETQLPYDHASYFPVYAKCAELGVPITVNVGIPGPRVPGRVQDPISLDEVCCFFPELTVVMSHGGDPWADVCVKLMTKWENLHYMTSAYSPRRIPTPAVDYLRGRGRKRVMWASDYPILEFSRCREQIAAMDLDEQTRFDFAYGNAARMFFPDIADVADVAVEGPGATAGAAR
ncbi:amidohydrolase family protein [Sporichthya brevicatena]|uniref:Amidohydrolase family protein n=1 Tax=Sporichthya brevicatena TaxID=171442 RepID=A0ABN1H4W0_9ACTN